MQINRRCRPTDTESVSDLRPRPRAKAAYEQFVSNYIKLNYLPKAGVWALWGHGDGHYALTTVCRGAPTDHLAIG